MKMIKLTKADAAAVCYVNADAIHMLAHNSEEGATEVDLGGSYGYVKEAPEEIVKLIEETDHLAQDFFSLSVPEQIDRIELVPVESSRCRTRPQTPSRTWWSPHGLSSSTVKFVSPLSARCRWS